MRQQSGSLYPRHGWWNLRFRQTISNGGTTETQHKAVRLCPVDERGTSKRVKALVMKEQADEIKRWLEPANIAKKSPETIRTVAGFVTDVYLPFVQLHKRASTLKGYTDMWEDHVSRVAGDALLRTVRTVDVQKWLEQIASQDKTKKGSALSHESLKHIKSLISGIFAHAKRQGFYDGANPCQNTAVPKGAEGNDTHAYSLDEVRRMIMVCPEPAATIIAFAAFTGTRRSEIQGLRWEDYRDGPVYVSRSLVDGVEEETKTKASAAPVPVIPYLARILETHRLRVGSPTTGPIFAATNKKPVSLNNVLGRVIMPAIKRDGVAQWHGWHAFRRGLATNLHDLGVDDKTIQAILRHSDVSVTQKCYVKTLPKQTVAAMQMLESALCADCAPGAAVFDPKRVN